jgi:hypothetical protein
LETIRNEDGSYRTIFRFVALGIEPALEPERVALVTFDGEIEHWTLIEDTPLAIEEIKEYYRQDFSREPERIDIYNRAP